MTLKISSCTPTHPHMHTPPTPVFHAHRHHWSHLELLWIPHSKRLHWEEYVDLFTVLFSIFSFLFWIWKMLDLSPMSCWRFLRAALLDYFCSLLMLTQVPVIWAMEERDLLQPPTVGQDQSSDCRPGQIHYEVSHTAAATPPPQYFWLFLTSLFNVGIWKYLPDKLTTTLADNHTYVIQALSPIPEMKNRYKSVLRF